MRLIPVILSPRRLTLPARRGSQVAEAAAHTGALCHAVRVEVPPVRIDAPADRRMAGHAILLLMTGRATLHALPRGAPVLQEPLRLRRVKGHVQPAARRQPAGLVTITAEGLGIVTRCAARLAAVLGGRMAHHEVCRMKPPPVLAGMAIGAEALGVAAAAGQHAGRCLTCMSGLIAGRMYAHCVTHWLRPLPWLFDLGVGRRWRKCAEACRSILQLDAPGAPRCRHRQVGDHAAGAAAGVTGEA